MVIGESGLFEKANNAKQATEEENEKEKKELMQAEASMHLENYEYTDAEGKTAIIPAGYAVSNEEGENLVDKGLVIIGKNGNEYVWIPCTKETYKRETSAWWIENDPTDNPTLATKDELTLTGATPSKVESDNGITVEVLNEIVEQVNKEIASVEKNKGYYIGRYEIGNENNKGVIQAKKEPYAGKKWSELYKIAKEIDVGEGATSYLCSSYAWDTAIKFIQTHSTATNYGTSRDGFNENWKDREVKDKNGKIIKKENERIQLKTGLTTPKANIYDMGGNVAEFTTELNPNTSEAVVWRGGYYNFYDDFPAGYRCDLGCNGAGSSYGARATLFIL